MKTTNNINDSSIAIAKEVLKEESPPKSSSKLYLIVGIVAGAAIVAIIVILAILIKTKDNDPPSRPIEAKQTLELLIEGNAYGRRRYLQNNNEDEVIQILGNDFNELDSSNANILINGKNFGFNKTIIIKQNQNYTVEIKFLKNITSFKGMFKGCNKIKNINLKNIETKHISETTSMFENCTELTDIKFENTSISGIISTSKMFKRCTNLNNINIENFSTNKTRDMSNMFEKCENLINTTFIENLSTENSENMKEMFSGCLNITSLNLSGFNTSKVKDMSGMFNGMNKLTTLVLSEKNFDTKNVENMSKMFYGCKALTSLNLSFFDVSKCNNFKEMFGNTSDVLISTINNEEILKMISPQTIELLIENNGNSNRMRNLEEEKIQIFGDNFSELNSSNANISINNETVQFNKIISVNSTKPINIQIQFSKRLSTFKEMFKGCKNISKIKLNNMYTEDISETTSMFEDCTGLSDIKFENMNIDNIESTAKMFKNCGNLNNINMKNFSTKQTKDMSNMFDNCNFLSNTTFIENLSTENSENMKEMFSGCLNIISLNLSGFNTSKVKDMSGMFNGMNKLKTLVLSEKNFDTKNVENMSKMFYGCKALTSLNLSFFDVSKCNNFKEMFGNTSDVLISTINNEEILKMISPQTIELLIENNGNSNRMRNLEEEKIQIFGDNFSELNSSNANISINNETVQFNKIISVNSTKPIKIQIQFSKRLSTFKEMFKGCKNINEIKLNNIYTKDILETTSMFEDCTGLNDIKFEEMNIDNIESTAKMFKNCESLNNITIEQFSTDKTKDMSFMFGGCSNLIDTNFIERLSTNNVKNMNEMFSGCSQIKSLDLSKFNTSKVENMSGIFKKMTSLEILNLSTFDTKNVVNMEGMFDSCSSLKELDLSSFNIENVIKIDNMFSNCINLENLDLSSFNLSKTEANITQDIFSNTSDLLKYSLSNREIEKSLGVKEEKSQTIKLLIETSGDNKNLGETIKIFGDSFDLSDLNDWIIFINGKIANILINNNIIVNSTNITTVVLKFSKQLKTFKDMFFGCQGIKEILLKDVEIDNLTETTSMFENCTSLKSVKFENVSITEINSTSKMFQGCSSLNKIELGDSLICDVLDMSRMFYGCSSLKDDNFIESLFTNSVTNMNEMFSGCSKIESLNLSTFDTNNVKNMSGMFKNMTKLNFLEISSFETDIVEDMSEMFQNCSSIKNLDLSNFNTTMVNKMDKMFNSCSSLENVNLTSFNLTNCNSLEGMFADTTKKLIFSIIENRDIAKKAGDSWSEKKNLTNNDSKLFDLMFLIDKNSLNNSSISKVKENIVYSAVNIINKEIFDSYNLSYGALFYNGSESTQCDFVKNVLNFTNFIYDINITSGRREELENWEGAFNLTSDLSWGNDSSKFIVHISSGIAKDYNKNTSIGNETDKIINYFAKNNYSIAGFYYNKSIQNHSFERAQRIFKENKNSNYIFKYFDIQEKNKSYFPNLVIESIQELLNNSKNR